MSNKESLQEYNARLVENTSRVESVLGMVEELSKPPEKGVVISGMNELGFPTKIDIYGDVTIPGHGFGSYNNGDTTRGALALYVEEVIVHNSEAKTSDIGAFRYMTGLKTFIAKEGMSSFHQYGFQACTSLKKVVFRNRKSINDYTFHGCSALKDVDISSSRFEGIRQYAFYGCSSLETIDIPPTATYINPYAFQYCTSLKIKTLPDSVATVYAGAFDHCTSLTQISLGGVTRLYGDNSVQGSFGGCTKLKAIWLNRASSMGMFTFVGCTALRKIFVNTKRNLLHTYYTSYWSNGTITNCEIICVDEEGFMTKEEFDAIDWDKVITE